jgi:beta propeller repeat protein
MKHDEHLRLTMLWLVLFSTVFIICPLSSASGTETPITTNINGFNHQFPKIFNDQIVWQDSDIQTMNFGIIYLYNITSGIETQVSDNTTYTTHPAIYGNLIAYTDCGIDSTCNSNSMIYLYNITSGTRTQISSGSDWQDFPAVYNHRIVWQDSLINTQIYINGTSPSLATQVSAPGSAQYSPAIYEDMIVWWDLRSGNPEIYLYNLTSHLETQITNNPSGSDQSMPAVYGNRIVWHDNRNGNYEIFINGTAPGDEHSLTPNDLTGIDHQNPAISGKWVVWEQINLTDLNYDIVVNDTSTNQKIPIALDRQEVLVGPSISFSPIQSLYRIVWEEQDSNGYYNIYLYTNRSPGTCPVAGFTNDFVSGTAPVTVHFTDTSSRSSSNPITHWFWDFGDGSNSTLKNPSHTYYDNQSYDVSLTVSNPYCRNATTVTNSVVVGRPVADFTASPTSEVVPATIAFTDTSLGNPTNWIWNFGDGTTSTDQNPTHIYTNPSSYTVSLTASTVYGSDTITKTSYITALAGANEVANTTINGITIQYHGGRQYLVFNNATLTAWTFNPNTSVLDFTPPSDRGFHNISIYTTDLGGFRVFPGNSTIVGNISSVHLQTKDITPTGFSVSTGGPFCSVNYSIDLPSYPENAVLNTQIWENATASDATNFNYIAVGSHFSGTNGTAYTTKIIKTNFPAGGTAQLHMSLNASLVASKPSGRNEVFVERITDDGQYGQVLGTRYLYHSSSENLDYFEADSPQELSTFGLSFLEGAGNLFQLLTLLISSHITPPSNPSNPASSYPIGGSGSGSGQHAPSQQNQPQENAPPSQPDIGKTAKLYINANSVITQATTLLSNDNLATLSIGQGIVAKDASGNALSSVTITGLPASEVPSATGSATYSFAGMAYDLQPNGATFSPAIALTFTIPKAQWGKDYTIQSYDHTTNTWQNLPTTYDPSKGTISAQVSHLCCFALFTNTITPVPNAHPTAQAINTPPITAPAPSSAMAIFYGMMLWVAEVCAKNIYLVLILASVAFAFFLFGRKKRLDRVRYKL